jgi:signal transduction histidine kinase
LIREQAEELHTSHATLSAVQRDVQQLEREMIGATAQARRRLAHDLHDGLGQHLTGLGIQTQLIRKQLQETAPEQSRQMRELERRILETTNFARKLARGLDRLVEADDSLVEALELVVSESHRLVGVKFEKDLEADVETPLREITLHLCHILEEAINNAVRHGAASSIRVRLRRDGEWGELSIEDNGSGEVGQLEASEGLGLRAMRYRARQIGGNIRFQDSGRGGVAVLIRFPCKT